MEKKMAHTKWGHHETNDKLTFIGHGEKEQHEYKGHCLNSFPYCI